MPSRKGPSHHLVSHSLKDLKKIMKKKRARTSAEPPSPKPAASPARISDEEAFLDAMKEVEEIREFRNIPVYHRKRKAPALKRRTGKNSALKGLEDIVKGRKKIDLPKTQEYVEWVHPDYRHEVVPDLHGGRFSVQESLDIHGLILEEAEVEIARFIKESVSKGLRCIKIIHGRGLRSPNGPVLKHAVVQWLSGKFRKHIAAFVTARRCDGGLGALYVLLR